MEAFISEDQCGDIAFIVIDPVIVVMSVGISDTHQLPWRGVSFDSSFLMLLPSSTARVCAGFLTSWNRCSDAQYRICGGYKVFAISERLSKTP